MLRRLTLWEKSIALAIVAAADTVYATPPPPPSSAVIPVTPLGGEGVYIATAIGMAAYGVWKARK
ncbi:hypothetical protein L4X63_21835 [Geomonas sp. Red32]|uniref:hypothetical protein n=1 Tax=Geomonas sp. Red32 TaxID=2912856 RepID=UPI00202CD1A9|nr:hypothetical protein [Geomonas sp. Red32]MCM0084228.1 hypothetical protein [Geomonas sp. Red32]